MRIVTLNCNGIRSAHSKGFTDWMLRQKADVVCLQEIKAHVEAIPSECREPRGYRAYFHPAEKPGYSGVAVYAREEPDRVKVGLDWADMDREGRYLQLDFGKVSVVSVYFPSGSSGELRQQKKYAFLTRFARHAQKLRKDGRHYVLCGDFNIAHKEIDLKNWRSNQKNSGFLPDERAWMDKLLGDAGWVDAFRTLNQKTDQYTWWSNRGRAYEKNVGWRIDYHVVTPLLKDALVRERIFRDQKFSDHAPLTIDYDLRP